VREVIFSPAAVRQYRRLPAGARSVIRKELRERLALDDATQENRNRFRLRRLSIHADYELRIEPWRVFYRIDNDHVIVELIGRKTGNILLIGGKVFEL